MEKTQITYRFTDIGHWIARCNHDTDVIEINGDEFRKLSPLFQDYVWIHEHVHLLVNEYNEAQCNKMTDDIFISRASSQEDLAQRKKFIERSNSVMTAFAQQKKPRVKKTSALAVIIAIALILVLIKN